MVIPALPPVVLEWLAALSAVVLEWFLASVSLLVGIAADAASTSGGVWAVVFFVALWFVLAATFIALG